MYRKRHSIMLQRIRKWEDNHETLALLVDRGVHTVWGGSRGARQRMGKGIQCLSGY